MTPVFIPRLENLVENHLNEPSCYCAMCLLDKLDLERFFSSLHLNVHKPSKVNDKDT